MNSIINNQLSVDPIFILGIGRRCGTNFLFHLLLLHPECRAGNVVREDFFPTHADALENYSESVYKSRDSTWRQQLDSPDLLLKYLGDGLLSFLDAESLKQFDAERPPVRLVTKTPDVTNLPLFFKLFPKAKLLIIVRDGRAVVESNIKSFKRNYDEVIHEWAAAARIIQQSIKTETGCRHLIIKYEDLHTNTEEEIKKIMSFLALDLAKYDFAAMHELPIFGSSQIVTEANQKVHWLGNKFENFSPIRRWHHWDRSLHERFNWVAGEELQGFGYLPQTNPNFRAYWALRNIIQDGFWGIEKHFLPGRKKIWKQWRRIKKYMKGFVSA